MNMQEQRPIQRADLQYRIPWLERVLSNIPPEYERQYDRQLKDWQTLRGVLGLPAATGDEQRAAEHTARTYLDGQRAPSDRRELRMTPAQETLYRQIYPTIVPVLRAARVALPISDQEFHPLIYRIVRGVLGAYEPYLEGASILAEMQEQVGSLSTGFNKNDRDFSALSRENLRYFEVQPELARGAVAILEKAAKKGFVLPGAIVASAFINGWHETGADTPVLPLRKAPARHTRGYDNSGRRNSVTIYVGEQSFN